MKPAFTPHLADRQRRQVHLLRALFLSAAIVISVMLVVAVSIPEARARGGDLLGIAIVTDYSTPRVGVYIGGSRYAVLGRAFEADVPQILVSPTGGEDLLATVASQTPAGDSDAVVILSADQAAGPEVSWVIADIFHTTNDLTGVCVDSSGYLATRTLIGSNDGVEANLRQECATPEWVLSLPDRLLLGALVGSEGAYRFFPAGTLISL